MTPGEIHSTYKKILSHLSDGRLKNALEKTEKLNNEFQSPAIKQKIESMQTNYKYMLQYFVDGVKDPERTSLYNKLIANVFCTAADLRDELLTRDANNFEFSKKRHFPFTAQLSKDELIRKLTQKFELDKELGEMDIEQADSDAKKLQLQTEFEEAYRYLFNYFWLCSDYNSDAAMAAYELVMSDEYESSVVKSLLVSALTLNLWRTFNENKLLRLLDACNLSDMHASQRALVGICFVLAKYNRFLPYFPNIRNRLVIMMDDNQTAERLQNIIIQIIGTTETADITKKLQEEIFPELMKLGPLMQEKLKGENPLNMDEWGEINPEWQEMIENSGASDKIQEFAEMEMSGADVYMSTFAMLKSFPFFSEISNWLIPFDTENLTVRELFESSEKSLISTFVSSNVMCNSDRYSFCMSILRMPEMQRNLMKQNFGEMAEQMDEMKKDEALHSPNQQAKTISKHYIQDLFRFFKLNPNRGDFADMFKTSLILHKTYLFDLLSIDDSVKSNIAEFYFSKKLYPQAIELFEESEKEGNNSAALYQKLGYAYQQNSQLISALSAYKKADLIQPDDFWTNRKIALCYRLQGDTKNALKTYRHADFIKPGNISVQLQIVNCLVMLDKHEEALKNLNELNNTHPDNVRIMRTTMTTAFSGNNMAQADYFASTLLDSGSAIAYDYLVAGMIAWCMNRQKEAKERYLKSLDLLENNWDNFVNLFKQEEHLLIENGVDKADIPLILDAVEYDS